MKRTPLKRGTKQLKRTPFKRQAPKPKVKKKRTKLPSIKTVRNKCDAQLTPIIKLMYPRSILSGAPTEVAHHHVHKSKSLALRYYIPNLIPLTHAEHQALHHNESYWASKIVRIRGVKWFDDLERKKNQRVKADVHWFLANLAQLQSMHIELLAQQ